MTGDDEVGHSILKYQIVISLMKKKIIYIRLIYLPCIFRDQKLPEILARKISPLALSASYFEVSKENILCMYLKFILSLFTHKFPIDTV